MSGEYSSFQLGWGELIPLHFLEKRPLVVVTPARKVPRETLIRFGEILAKALEGYYKKVGLIISADHGHAHNPQRPLRLHARVQRIRRARDGANKREQT
ncbi:hypothetical protein [Thermococcus piezophilus]|uniref:hypothetical protein n=1 Tax=Thermococcus piezophilus TaxID=1712654 RepID=UPI000AE868BB|nr:hypothetical protein [Thermococcus piezophilus]